MRLFAIHASSGAASEDVRALKTGFCVAALLLGPLWLLARGLWLALAGYVLAAALVLALQRFGALGGDVAFALFGLGNLYLAVEGRALAGLSWARAGWPLVDVVHARSALEAEKVHLERLPEAPASSRMAGAGAGDIIGLFPEAGR